jgi:Flp pilus assembly protein TadG
VPDRSARGSALMLVPAGVLVLVALAAMAVDTGVVYLGQRQLADAVSAAANDAAGAGISDAGFYRSGAVRLDESRVASVVCATIRSQSANTVQAVAIEVAVSARVVSVRAIGRVPRVFGGAIPGVSRNQAVRAEATAVAAGPPGGPGSAPVLPFHSISC